VDIWAIDADKTSVVHGPTELRVGRGLPPEALDALLSYLVEHANQDYLSQPGLADSLREGVAYARTKIPKRVMIPVRIRVTYEAVVYADDLKQATQAAHKMLELAGPEELTTSPMVFVAQLPVSTIPKPTRAINADTGEVDSLEDIPYVPVYLET